MPHTINEACIKCGACSDTCPVSAISEGDAAYVIDPDACIDCGACADICPTGAIKPL
ncbi:MAG: 4Fe-4S binding protein [Clostridiales bacterium]|jgi:NAD-dependent dihydropyrimidine dehydrogenase PreA subunit|nr:4Fe-4S binding protein [Clostridiales bacterium]